jgi:hypothetical protein
MCLAVYLASSAEIPGGLRGRADAHAFYLEPVPAGNAVRRHFAVPYVYYAGSHEVCGCGFMKDGRDDDDRARSQADYDALARCIRSTQAAGATVELFACWEGDQADDPDFPEMRSVEDIEDPAFEFREGQFVSVR